ncbi:MAG: endonuclease/exonuclease/phosphatase family protein [Clostridia bacterium]|nr:endonuclease/exonuclease/phosphatase family protein [Clostridia bacterium]
MSLVKIMTFNIRMDTEYDGINSFTNRFNRVLEVINKELPDVIGFQEVTDSMRDRLRRALPDYCITGCGRDKNLHGEAMMIAYRADKIELLSCDNIWLSLTPNIPGSRYGGDQSGCPRMYTTTLLKHNDTKEPFRFINTHLDHHGKNARYLGALQLVQAISQYKEKFVLTGDFNAEPSSPEIQLITSALSYRGAIDCTDGFEPTFHAFGQLKEEEKVKIDYIFTDGKCENAYIVEDIPVNGQYYSDHFAICAYIEL